MTIPEDFPWPNDVIIDHGTHAGVPWVARQHPFDFMGGQVNGYIKLPEDHPWVTTDDYINTGVPWGEITFHGNNGWIGFDTGHSGQAWPNSEITARFIDEYTTIMTNDLAVAWTQLFAANAVLATHGHTFGHSK